MSYKHNKDKVVGVRKMRWDQLWHVLYNKMDYFTHKEYLTWDRVSKKEAMEVAQIVSR